MKIIVAEISAIYAGRGNTILHRYPRVLMVKADGSVAIHGEKGFKPMNYMTPPIEMTETLNGDGELVLVFDSRNESLVVTCHKVLDEVTLELGIDDPGMESDNTEKDLQEWLSDNLTMVKDEYAFVEREYQTGNGPVDILAEDMDGGLVAVEVKRVAPMGTVSQVLRYVDGVEEKFPARRVRGAIAALEIKDKTKILADKKNIELIEIPTSWRELRDEE